MRVLYIAQVRSQKKKKRGYSAAFRKEKKNASPFKSLCLQRQCISIHTDTLQREGGGSAAPGSKHVCFLPRVRITKKNQWCHAPSFTRLRCPLHRSPTASSTPPWTRRDTAAAPPPPSQCLPHPSPLPQRGLRVMGFGWHPQQQQQW